MTSARPHDAHGFAPGVPLAAILLIIAVAGCGGDPDEQDLPYWLGDPEPGMCDEVETQWQATVANYTAWGGSSAVEDQNGESIVLSSDGDGCSIDGDDYCSECNTPKWLDIGIPTGLGPGVYALSGSYDGPIVQDMECYLPGDANFCLMGGHSGATGRLVIETRADSFRGCLLDIEGPSWLEVGSIGFEVEACP